ncbi:hypothetical protein AAEO56_03295 [Flavobacterium sp. DGU11]|uniref:Uncharacterized protein n=1 Tax=Flavobacterium arundinis TaxID=3139143 RepID=A0ABU9HU84_9FLAO
MENKPWDRWQINDVPFWWTANNKIKHQRANHFEKANLKNAFNAIGALLLTVTYFYKLKLESERGKTISWNYVTQNYLRPSTSVMRLEDKFYNEW